MRGGSKVEMQPDASRMLIGIRFPTDSDSSNGIGEMPVFTDREGIHGYVVFFARGELAFDSVVITTEGVSCTPSILQGPMMVTRRADFKSLCYQGI